VDKFPENGMLQVAASLWSWQRAGRSFRALGLWRLLLRLCRPAVR